MHKNVEVLLTENVYNLGIVGDVVKVRTGYARNFLLPRGIATEPSEDKMKELASKREEAERQLRELRAQREKMIEKLDGYEISLTRSCNDQGQLYGSVTQKDIADALTEEGFNVNPRDVRLPQTIKRVDSYMTPIKLDQDLETEIKVWVAPDRELVSEERAEMEFDAEGNLIERPSRAVEEAAETYGETESGEAAGDAKTPTA